MTEAEYEFIRNFVRGRSGLFLAVDKRYLVESRLLPVARRHGFASLSDLVGALSARRLSAEISDQVVEAMTTNESSFFRDRSPFEGFRDVMLPHFQTARVAERRIRVWSAAASTGQEPYSIAMAFTECQAQAEGWRLDVLATDISPTAVSRGRLGRYSEFEVQRGLTPRMLERHFTRAGDYWQINETIRCMVQWKLFNLLDSFVPLGRFDVIFCRNVLIYFEQSTKSDVLGRLADSLAPDGFLVLGGAETVVGLTDRFRSDPAGRGLYRPMAQMAHWPAACAAAS